MSFGVDEARSGADGTPARDVFLPVDEEATVADRVAMARRAEESGYDRVWSPETWGRDAVTALAAIIGATEEIGIGTSIANVYARSPALLGQTAATLQEHSSGRFRLGVGPSGPILVEGWHGVTYERPLRRTREAVEIVRQVLAGETVQYDGEVFTLSGFRLRSDPPDPSPSIDVAGMGPKSVELAGRFGDGWHALMLTPDGLRERLADFERGGELGGRNRDDQRVTVAVPCCALSDGDRARELAAQHVAFYVGGMGTFYREALAAQGYEEEAHEIAQRWANRDRDGASAVVRDEVLSDLGAFGTPDECRERFEDFTVIDGVDAVSVSFPRGANTDERRSTLDALAPR